MKLFTSVGPNPRVVNMFLAEKGVSLERVYVDVMGAENRRAVYLKRNPHGQTPTLELDDGSYISEILAICEYLEEKFPASPLIGSTPEERAECRMWTRRVDLNICEPMTNGHRFSTGLALFRDRMVTVPEAADGLKRIAQDRLRWLDSQMTGRDYLCRNRFTLADIHLFSFVAFGAARAQTLNPEFKNIKSWFNRISARPSAQI